MEILEERLRKRGTEDEDGLKKRLDQARLEMAFATSTTPAVHDLIVVNGDLETAYRQVEQFCLLGQDS